MPAWIAGIQGIREILNSAGTALTRRKLLQFGAGFTAADDGSKTVVTLGSPSASYAAALAPLLRGVGLTVNSDDLLQAVQRPRRHEIVERFAGGGVTSGTIGREGWHLLGTGTPAFARLSGDLQNSERCSLTTTTGASDTAVLCLGETLSRTVQSAALTDRVHLAHSFNSDLANKRFFFGFSTDFATAPASVSGCLGFLYDAGVSPNWQIIARSSGVGSPSVTATAAPVGGALLTILQPTSGTYEFYSDAVLIGTISSGAPTGAMNFGVQLMNLSGAARNHRLGGIWLTSKTLAGVYDNDTFLEV